MNKLVVISDTKAYLDESSTMAFGPVVREFENMKPLFSNIEWLVFRSEIKRRNFLDVDLDFMQLHFFKNMGGHSTSEKVKILLKLPSLFFLICKLIKKSDYIHLRAPSVPCLLALVFIPFYPKKTFWFKYAGNWVGHASLSYKVQRKLYRIMAIKFKNVKLTINGSWESHHRIFNFQNPCLTKEEKHIGELVTKVKLYKQRNEINICFVGNLSVNKGILNLLEAFSVTSFSKPANLFVVGDSEMLQDIKRKYEEQSINNIIFYGQLLPIEVHEIYKTSDFLCLPSKSEGFPKVIGECMNYGVIPIVTDISSIGQIINNDENGFLLKDNGAKSIAKALNKVNALSDNDYKSIIRTNSNLVENFTYNYYNKRINKSIFKKL